MSKYRYAYIIQQSITPTIWKDFFKLREGQGKADAVSQLLTIQSRNRNNKYRIIKRRYTI